MAEAANSSVIKLPTAATSYFTVRKAGRFFDVVLVTPGAGKSLKTSLARFADRDAAIHHGKDSAALQRRPFKAKGAAQ